MGRQGLLSFVIVIVTVVWALVALVSMIIHEYTALIAVTPVMVTVVGFLTGRLAAKTTNGNGYK